MLCLAVLPLAAALCACYGEDLSKDKEYAEIIGKEYLTKKALLVSPGSGFSGYLDVPGEGGAPGLTDIQLTFPQRYGGKTYIGLMPSGSRVKITEIYTNWSTLSGEYTAFRLKVLKPHEFSSLKITEVGLIDYDRRPLRLKGDLFEEAPPRAKPEKEELPPGTRTAGDWGRQ